jgi:hypothetical protein
MFRHRELVSDDVASWTKHSANYSDLKQDEGDDINYLIRSEILHKYYLGVTEYSHQNWNKLVLGCRTAKLHQTGSVKASERNGCKYRCLRRGCDS